MSGGQAKFQLRVARSGESPVYRNSSNGAAPLCHCVPLALAAMSAVAIANIAVDTIAVTADVTVAVNVDAGTVVAAVTSAIIVVNAANGVVNAVY